MRKFRLLLVPFLLLIASCSFAQNDWLPITPQDWQITDDPSNPGAAAIQLYNGFFLNDDEKFASLYLRVKILRPAGLKYANREIPTEPLGSLASLSARTIHPDGTIIDFKDKVFEKTIFVKHGVKVLAKVFTLPDVTVGSIIEVRYKIEFPRNRFHTTVMFLQGDISTVKADFRFQPIRGGILLPHERYKYGFHYSQSKCTYLHGLTGSVPQRKSDGLMELTLENVPVFHGEDYMPPEYDYAPVMVCYYGGHEVDSPDKFWDQTGREWGEWTDKFIGNHQEIRKLAEQVMGSETDPEKKLRKLYARAQQIRNLTYERTRTGQESKKEGLKSSTDVMEVLNHGYGTSDDITRFFVALAKAAGFEAYVIQVSDREEFSFEKHLMFTGQVASAEALVKLNGKDLALDPGTPFCPFGLVPWQQSDTTALKLSASGSELITTPATMISNTHRVAKLELASDGSAKGEITLELLGEDALQHRLDALKTDEAGRAKDFESEVQAFLPAGASVKLKDAQGWESTDEPLLVHFDVNIPNFASGGGKRLVAPAYVFPPFRKGMFSEDSRMYPIVFPYPFNEDDEIDLKAPEGYSLEVPPYNRKAGLSYAAYAISNSEQGNQLVIRRSFRFEGTSFPPEKYLELKNFFVVVQAGDAGQAVFKPAEAADAQRSN